MEEEPMDTGGAVTSAEADTKPLPTVEQAAENVADEQLDSLVADLVANAMLLFATNCPLEPFNGSEGLVGTLLHVAVTRSAVACVRELCQRGADLNVASTGDGWTPVLMASCLGNVEIVKVLTGYGADVDKALLNNNQSALHLATVGHRRDVVQVLLESGSSTECADQNGHTPLLCAIAGGDSEVVSLLLTHGASPNLVPDGSTPLQFAVAAEQPSLDVVKLLVRHGARPSVAHPHSGTPAMIAESRSLSAIAAYLTDAHNLECYPPQISGLDKVLVLVKGAEGRGKSAVIDGMKPPTSTTKRLQGFFFRGSSQDTASIPKATDESGHTLGIHLVSQGDQHLNLDVTFAEFGGQLRFQSALSHIESARAGSGVPAMLVVVVSALDDYPTMESAMLDALNEYLAFCKPCGEGRKVASVVVVCTHIDKAKALDQLRLNTTFKGVHELFKEKFDFHHKPLFLDAQKKSSAEMNALRETILRLAKETVDACQLSWVTKEALNALPEIRKRLGRPMVLKAEFLSGVVSVVSESLGAERPALGDVIREHVDDTMLKLLGFMEIDYVSSADSVVLEPRQLWTTVFADLIKLRDASVVEEPVKRYVNRHPFKARYMVTLEERSREPVYSSNLSRVKRDDVVEALGEFPAGDRSLELAAHLTGATPVNDELVAIDYPECHFSQYHIGRWPFDPKYEHFAGRRFVAPCGTGPHVRGETFSRSFMVCVITEMYARFRRERCRELIVFRDGMGARAPGGEAEGGLITRSPRNTVDVCVRSDANEQRSMYALLQVMCAVVRRVHRRLCPGVAMTEVVLSPRELEIHVQRDPERDRAFARPLPKTEYTHEQVEAALPTNGLLHCPRHYNTDHVLWTMAQSADHVAFISVDTVRKLNNALPMNRVPNWGDMAVILDISPPKVDALSKIYSCESPEAALGEAIQIWGNRGSGGTVSALIRILREADADLWKDAIAILAAEQRKPFVGTPNYYDPIKEALEKKRQERRERGEASEEEEAPDTDAYGMPIKIRTKPLVT